jgi:ferredoxin
MDADKRRFMNEIRKHPLNVQGKYYIDYDSCLNHCCFDTAPNNFKLDENYIAYVFKQPETQEEVDQCNEAIICCAFEAIHDDGNE